MEDVIPNEGCIITVSHRRFIKRTEAAAYRSQKRGGKGIIGSGSYDEDFIEHLFTASTHDYIMFFMNNGRVYVEKVYEIPEGSRTSKGRAIANVLALQKDEKIAAMICVKEFSDDQRLVMVTRNGVAKKTNLKDFANFRKGGIIGINIDEGDQLIGVRLTSGEDEIVIVTHLGMSIGFRETDLREQGRATRGVRGISLKKNDVVETFEIVRPGASLLIAGEDGLGKRSSFDEYRLQTRGGSGIIAMRTTKVAGALTVDDDDEIVCLTSSGQTIRCPVNDIRIIGRTTRGVRLVNLGEGERLIGIARIVEVAEEEA